MHVGQMFNVITASLCSRQKRNRKFENHAGNDNVSIFITIVRINRLASYVYTCAYILSTPVHVDVLYDINMEIIIVNTPNSRKEPA